MKENACGCCYMTSNIPMKCTCQWCHQAIEKELEPVPVELPDELKGPVVMDDLSRFTVQGYYWKGEYYPMKGSN